MAVALPTIGDCRTGVFPLVESRLPQAFSFAGEAAGCRHLEAILDVAGHQAPDDPLAVAAHLFSAIIAQRPFTAGNEALAVALLAETLLRNGFSLGASSPEMVREQLQWLFPKMRWEERADLAEAHQLFFYHLARVLADPAQKGALTAAQEQAAVRHLLPLVALRT